MPSNTPRRSSERGRPKTLPNDVALLPWAADQLGIGISTAYRLAAQGKLPGLFRVGQQYRVSIPRFLREVHGDAS